MPHTPVLQNEVNDLLDIQPDETVVDMTVGEAGHSQMLCQKLNSDGKLIGIDQDEDAVQHARSVLEDECECKIEMITGNFRNIDEILQARNISEIDKVLFDLGLRSSQLEESERGFSFQKDEPLLMTFKKHPTERDLTAWEIVNRWEEENIADVLYGYGDERYSRQIAEEIVSEREEGSIETTQDLVTVIERAVPEKYKHGRIHPATRTFQALRIAVNDEVNALREGLQKAFDYLSEGGRIAVISFHSLEDRTVKNTFKELKEKGSGKRLAKKPITPTESEINENPRSRSAKLRGIEKI